MEGWVNLGGWLDTEMVYSPQGSHSFTNNKSSTFQNFPGGMGTLPPRDGHPSKY